MEKVKRDGFLYLEPDGEDDDFGQCADCKMFLEKLGLCSLHGKGVKIKPTMSCGLFVPGGPAKESELEHMAKNFTPAESGLVDREVRCENCISFMDNKCKLFAMLNRLSPANFDLNAKVEAQGCCNAQRPRVPASPLKRGFLRKR